MYGRGPFARLMEIQRRLDDLMFEGIGSSRALETPELYWNSGRKEIEGDCGKGRCLDECRSQNGPLVRFDRDAENSVLKVALPGIESENVKVGFYHGYLIVRYEQSKEESSNNFFSSGEVRQKIGNVDVDKVSADYKNGVLYVTMPKSGESEDMVQIEVNSDNEPPEIEASKDE